jgi:diacylglycerol kinase (ATP)
MAKPGAQGIARMVAATRYSAAGLKAAWQHEAAFRQEVIACALLTPCAFLLGQSAAEVAILLTVLGLVVVVELLNSAIEAVVDRIGSEHHTLAGRAKDMGSAAVSISLILVVVVWSVVAVGRL